MENKDSVSLLFGVGKTLENLESNILIDHLEEGGLFSDVGHDFRSSCLIADPLTIIADGIARTFNIFAVAQIVWHDVPMMSLGCRSYHKFDSHGIHGRAFKVISSFIALDSKSLKECYVKAENLKAVFSNQLSLLYINDVPSDAVSINY